MTIIWDNSIGLRPFEDPINDAEVARVYQWCRDENLLRWSGGAPSDLSLAEFRERLQNDQHDFLDQRRVFFILTRDQRVIGRVGLFALDWARREGELGIVIGEPTEWDKGYGSRAIMLLLRHLFETTPLERVYLFTFSENVRAQRCFASCGFRTLGVTQRFLPELGERAGIEMEITRREFLARQDARGVTTTPIWEQCPSEFSSR